MAKKMTISNKPAPGKTYIKHMSHEGHQFGRALSGWNKCFFVVPANEVTQILPAYSPTHLWALSVSLTFFWDMWLFRNPCCFFWRNTSTKMLYNCLFFSTCPQKKINLLDLFVPYNTCTIYNLQTYHLRYLQSTQSMTECRILSFCDGEWVNFMYRWTEKLPIQLSQLGFRIYGVLLITLISIQPVSMTWSLQCLRSRFDGASHVLDPNLRF